MEYTRLGDTGLKISRLALGCMSYGDPDTEGAHRWALADDEAQPFFRQAIELGITFWDTANVYQAGTSEENQYNLLRRQDEPELMAMCADTGVGLVPYSPQGKGRLARPWGEQSTRSSVDHVVQAFDSTTGRPGTDLSSGRPDERGWLEARMARARSR
jgi:aryl-alcohol dehydrogenase-like predicted oxidoreductase